MTDVRLRPGDDGYYASLKKQEAAWPANEPLPEVTTRDPKDDKASPEPVAVRTLARLATEHGFPARIGYSRGKLRAQKVGTYKTSEIFSVWAGSHKETGWRFYAMYEQNVDAKTGFTWTRTAIWHPEAKQCGSNGIMHFTHASRTDLTEFIKAGGRMPPEWYDAIERRVGAQKEKQKAAAKSRTKKKEAN